MEILPLREFLEAEKGWGDIPAILKFTSSYLEGSVSLFPEAEQSYSGNMEGWSRRKVPAFERLSVFTSKVTMD